ncbi:MAG TPA: TfoX/Sxy family protein [Alphaproteobacteria bacterium]|nr:TfoX/Sxy family protein [Alphaproteobacteria bacterium]
MAWEKSSHALVAAFDAAVPDGPAVERRQMFGYPCAFVNNNMFMGLHEQNFILRLSEEDRAEIKASHNAAPFEPMKGRAMKEYVALPDAILGDAAALGAWVARSFAFASALPVKEKKPRKKKAKG